MSQVIRQSLNPSIASISRASTIQPTYPYLELDTGYGPINFSTGTPGLDIEDFLFKFSFIIFLFLLFPCLSLQNATRTRSRVHGPQCQVFPASYIPDPAIVDAPFKPLPTRKYFRISHIGNRPELDSDLDSDNEASSSIKNCRLVFGKQLRGEESQFKGKSSLKRPGPKSLPKKALRVQLPNQIMPPLSLSVISSQFS